MVKPSRKPILETDSKYTGELELKSPVHPHAKPRTPDAPQLRREPWILTLVVGDLGFRVLGFV